jgi:PEP-CTERM motif
MLRMMLFFGLAIVSVAAMPQRGSAAVATFTSRDAWLAALPGVPSQQDTFDNLRDGFFASPLRRSGYSIVADNGLFTGTVGTRVVSTNSAEQMKLEFSKPILAVGLKVGLTDFDFRTRSGTIIFHVGTDEFERAMTGLEFLGFISTDEFIDLKIDPKLVASSLYPTIDNVEFYADSSSSNVPEPGSLAIFSLGGVAVTFWRRRQRAKLRKLENPRS